MQCAITFFICWLGGASSQVSQSQLGCPKTKRTQSTDRDSYPYNLASSSPTTATEEFPFHLKLGVYDAGSGLGPQALSLGFTLPFSWKLTSGGANALLEFTDSLGTNG